MSATIASGNQRLARRLAKQLLMASAAHGDARLVNAFQAFLALLQAGDAQANDVLCELAQWHQADRAEPYFLESLQTAAQDGERKRHGIYYTPGPVAEFIVRRIEQLLPAGPLRIVDPACGGGVFLLAAARLAASRPGSSLVGYDVSPAAVEVARQLSQDKAAFVSISAINPMAVGENLRSELLASAGDPATLVILGNPPYANYGRLNRGEWIDGLVADYRRGVTEQKLNLTDDFIKFLRWGQHWIDQAGQGVLAMITSRTFLAGLTHRGMRRSLAESFAAMEIIDLHGDGEAGDENIFSIRRGVAIGVFANVGQASSLPGKVKYTSLRGSRTEKLKYLQQDEQHSTSFTPREPDWLFVPAANPDTKATSEYFSWPRLDEIFVEFISGVQTKNDALFVDFDRQVLSERMQGYLAEQGESFDPTLLRPYVVGPFDRRWIYYDPRLLGRSRWPVMRHMIQAEPNVALVFMRQSTSTDPYDHALVVDCLASDRAFYSRRGAPFLAPLWLTADASGQRLGNLQAAWRKSCSDRLGYCPTEEASFAYVYAMLHSSYYRREYSSKLQRDFPRIPWPWSADTFSELATLGKLLIDCHILQTQAQQPLPEIGDTHDLRVARGYPQLQGDIVQLNRRGGIRLTDPSAWSFRVGGYQVIKRWLNVRRGRELPPRDLQYVAGLCEVAVETQRLAREIDLVMASRGSRSRLSC